MSQSTGAVRNGLVLRFSAPATGEMRAVATALAIKVAEQLGVKSQGDTSVGRAIEDLARRVVRSDGDGDVAAPGISVVAQGLSPEDIAFEFHKLDRELKIEARSNGRASETRIPLPA